MLSSCQGGVVAAAVAGAAVIAGVINDDARATVTRE